MAKLSKMNLSLSTTKTPCQREGKLSRDFYKRKREKRLKITIYPISEQN